MDYDNHRILIWNKGIPTSNFTAADVVIGQPDFVTVTAGTGANKFNSPATATTIGSKLIVADQNNNRVLIWNTIPTSNNISADSVLGQSNFNSTASGLSPVAFNIPYAVYSDGKRLFLSDANNHRILIWNSVPTVNNSPADLVLGQNDFMTANTVAAENSLRFPVSIFSDGRKLFVGDRLNERVLIYNFSSEPGIKLGPQFEQGKGVLGKVFWDWNGNGIQEEGDPSKSSKQESSESGIEGVKVVSDTGIYAITDEDGKYHFPYLETGQRVLKMDRDTLPEDAEITTDNPYKVVVTEGVLTKVSFGVKRMEGLKTSDEQAVSTASPSNILLKVSVAQESSQLKPRLGVTVEMGKEKQEGKLVFTIDCNYFLFIKRSELKIYDQDQKLVKTIELPQPVPLYFELPLEEITPLLREENQEYRFHYQVSVYDKNSAEDRTSLGFHKFTRYLVP